MTAVKTAAKIAKKKSGLTTEERLRSIVVELEQLEAEEKAAKKQKAADRKTEREESVDDQTSPQIMALVEQGILEEGDANFVIDNLERAAMIRSQIGQKPDHEKGKDGSGLLAALDDLTASLLEFQFEHRLAGLKHGDIEFRASMMDGRETLDKQKLRDALLMKGVDLDVIRQCFKIATKQGDAFPMRKLILPGLDD